MTAITLPAKPTGEDYEDFVVSALKALGYFTETRKILRDGGREVLELDVVATPTGGATTASFLVEAKKGTFKFENVFKLFGQRTYLGFDRAVIACSDGCPEHEKPVFERHGASMNVTSISLAPDPAETAELATPMNALSEQERALATAMIWYGQIAQRVSQAEFEKEYKGARGDPYLERARTYHLRVQESYFEKDPLHRAYALYKAYQDAQQLTGGGVGRVASATGLSAKDVWTGLRQSHAHLWLQFVAIREHSARITIIKHALDIAAGGGPGVIEIAGHSIRLTDFMPGSFMTSLELLKSHPHRDKLPYLYQVFLEVFGGFLYDTDPDELALLSRFTGIPETDLLPCLDLLDKFFPSEKSSWYRRLDSERLRVMIMVPGIVRGVGVFLRKAVFGQSKYKTSAYSGVQRDLAEWNNALVEALQPTLGVVSTATDTTAT